MSRQETAIFCQKTFSLKLTCKMKITSSPILRFIYFFFSLNVYSFRALLVAHASMFPSEQGFKKDTLAAKKMVFILLKRVLLKLNFEHKCHFCVNCFFNILDNYSKCRLFRFLHCGTRLYIATRTGVQIRHISGWKMVKFCKKMYF